MTDREIMQQALDALELLAKYESPLTRWQVRKMDVGRLVTIKPQQVAANAAAVLRERLAQPVAALSLEEEREACADIADQHASCEGIAQKIAAEIRGRK